MKRIVKTVVPGVVGGVTSFGVGTASTLAGGGPITGAMKSKLTKDALDESLGNGIKECKMGDGISDTSNTR